MNSRTTLRRGFTLIELLLVIGIIAILASIVIVAINPTRQLNSARDAQRRADVNTIVNAVYQYAIDNNQIPSTILSGTGYTNAAMQICKTQIATSVGCTGLRMLSGTYLVSIPNDPNASTTGTGTYYRIWKNPTTNRVTVSASGQITTGISVTR